MKLQQIKLAGFKSFVEATSIDIHGQLVGIVGPNGCGKSNVIDAVRWVLGESSAKQLRGESMLDVIFNGSVKRKPVSRATVELVFENSQKSLYGLWNSYDEISIKRLISRQGESVYSINNQAVRRKDIADLFLGTGVGTKGYAVIEQGMISRIIESKPEDMRLFIEEAAGVSKYRERRKETLQRLGDTQENLQRLEDIHSEIIKQLASLSQQAEVAQLHQSLSRQLRDQQSLQLAIKVDEASRALDEANQFIKHCEEELRVLGYQLEEAASELAIEQQEKSVQQQLLQDLMQQFNEHRTSLARVEERFKHYTDLLLRFERESVNLNKQQQELEQDIEELTLQSSLIEDEQAQKQLRLTEQTLLREDLQLLVDAKQQLFDDVARLSQERHNKLTSFKHSLALLENSLSHKQPQKQALSGRFQRLVEEQRSLNFDPDYSSIQEEISQLQNELAASENELQAKQQQQQQLLAEEAAQRQQQAVLEQAIAASQSKIATLTNFLYPPANESDAYPFSTLPAPPELWQFLEVAPGYEVALEAALAKLLAAKVISDITTVAGEPASQLTIWLQSERKVSPDPASLSAKVQINHPQLAAIYTHLNRFRLIADSQQASQLADHEFGLTLSGHLVTRDYVIYHASQDTLPLLQQQQQLVAEQANYQALSAQLVGLKTSLQLKQAKLEALNNELASLSSLIQRLIQKQHNLQLEFTKQQQIVLQNQSQQARLAAEAILVEQELHQISNELASLEIQIEDRQFAGEELHLANQDFELKQLDAETALQLAKNKLYDLDHKANQLIIDNQLFKQQKLNAENLINEKTQQLNTARQKLVTLNEERISFNNTNQAADILELQEKVTIVTAKMQQVQQLIDALVNKVLALKNKSGSLNSSYQRNLEKINQTKFKQQEQQILLATYNESISRLNLDPQQLATLLSGNSLSWLELAQQSKALEEGINQLGLVNLKALEDLQLATAKEQELLKQLDDLRQAAEMLQQAIMHIDGETRKLLQQTFDKLNLAIVVYFRTLFGGGDARLALTDKDILVAGVQIFAEPPGKKTSTIHLLSGGEKALAAMSFIFALFSLNPAPFCLLDEVDAPLDDANTSRFCNLVQELSAKTQFVYISHNRLAMEMADQLIGVTMQEKGISTTLSVSLQEALRQAELESE